MEGLKLRSFVVAGLFAATAAWAAISAHPQTDEGSAGMRNG